MATEIKLPRLGQGMESGVIVRWLKAEGDTVTRGDPLYELDTDKVTQEVEAEQDGVLTKIVVAEGEVEVGTTVAVIDENGSGPPGATEAPVESEAPAASAAEAPAAEKPAKEEATGERVRAGGRRRAGGSRAGTLASVG